MKRRDQASGVIEARLQRMEHVGKWRTPQAQQRCHEIEAQFWREMVTELPASLDIETSVGTTRVYHWPGAGNPVVLLHGMGGTSIMWAKFVQDLDGREVYAIDTMGDTGRSVQRVAFRDGAHMAEWLDETLPGLGVDKAHLAGNSYGAWLAMQLALHAPDRVLSLSLLDPGGLAKLSYRFLVWGAKIFAAAFTPGPIRRWAAGRTRMPLLEDRRVMRLGLYAQIDHPFRLPLEVLTDDHLRAISAPTLLLIGGKSEIYKPDQILSRASAHMADVEAVIIPDVGHALPIDPKARAGERVRDFLALVDGRRETRTTSDPSA